MQSPRHAPSRFSPTGRRQAPARFTLEAAARRAIAAVGPLLAAGLLLACGEQGGALAIVAGQAVTLAEIDAEIRMQTGKERQAVAPELAAALFENFLEDEVILASSPQDSDRELAGTQRSTRARELLSELCSPPLPPSDEEISAVLAADGSSPPGAERVQIRQLVLADQAAALAAAARARQGEDFVELSRQLSRAPNADRGGTIGWVQRGQLSPEFEAAIAALPPGGVSDPVASSSGWHVLQVVERRLAGQADEETGRQRAREELAAVAAERQRRQCLLRLASEVGVEVRCAAAPFPCRNPFEEKP